MGLHPISQSAQEKVQKSIDFFQNEIRAIRTGKASPVIVEHLKVDYYGSPTPLQQLAVISVPDTRTLIIKPYDTSILANIEKAILSSELSLNPQNDGKVIRITIPPLSEERRIEYTQLVNKKLENAKVSVRNVRRDVLKELEKGKKDKTISEDLEKKIKAEVQKIVDDAEKKLTELAEKKNKEILQT